MLTVNQCPICKGQKFNPHLTCTDHTVSHETFSIIQCQGCGLLITSPRPVDHELPKYYLSDDYISHSNKSTSIIDKVYKIARQFSLNWKVNIINSHVNIKNKAKPSLLDVGCGTGEFIKKAKDRGWNVAGVEPSAVARAQASTFAGIEIHEHVNSIEGEFDAITLWHVLEHIPDLHATIEKLKSKLSENGMVFIAVPNHQSDDASRYKNNWAGYDVPRHLWHFNQSAMKLLLSNHSLSITQTIPMKLDAFYVSLLSEKYERHRTSPAAMVNAFLTGMKSNRRANKTTEYSSLIYIANK